MNSGKRFQAKLAKKGDGYKLIEWKKPTYAIFPERVKTLTFGDIEVFEPKSISLKRVNKALIATIKSETSVRYGFVSKNWVFWYLSQMRAKSIVHLIVNAGRFSNGSAVNQGNFGPSCVNYHTVPDYTARCMRTEFDNKKKFFFA